MEIDDTLAQRMSNSSLSQALVENASPPNTEIVTILPDVPLAAKANHNEDHAQQAEREVALATGWKDRVKPRHTPDFYELEDIDFSAPPVGSLRFLNDTDSRGSRVPYKRLQARLHVLPPKEQPFFQQMQSYCQRWAVWAATIEDEARRREVLEMVTNKMLDAWKFGVLHGHYSMGAIEAAEKQQLTRHLKSDKRGRDRSKAMAPFAMENAALKNNNIVNSELEAVGVTLDMINLRIERDELSQGENLLAIMKKRLGRSIEFKDWTSNKRGQAFRAGQHKRNLLMYALWEVQRCRKTVADHEVKLAGRVTPHQSKTFSTRVDIYRTRALQHLALAIELNLKEPVDETNSPVDDDSESEIAVISATESVVEVNGNNNQTNTTKCDEKEAVHIDAVGHIGDTIEDSAARAPEHPEIIDPPLPEDYNMLGSFFDDAYLSPDEYVDEGEDVSQMPDLPAMTPDMENLLTEDYRKRWIDEPDPQENPEHKKQKFHHEQPTIPFSGPPGAVLMQNPQTFLDRQPESTIESQHNFGHPLAHPSLATDNSTKVHENNREQSKQRFIAERWQHKLNALLASRGHGHLTWALTNWSDIRSILEHLHIDVCQRNAYLREYKSGLEQMGIAADGNPENEPYSVQADPRTFRPAKIVLKLPQLPSQQGEGVDEPSQEDMEQTRGFAFRCFPDTSEDQRARLDELVNDYVSDIIASRTKRHGLYVIVHDPEHHHRMPIAHGFWNTKKGEHPDGADWFYQGQPRPKSFRPQTTWHIHDFEDSPPQTPARIPQTRATKSRRQAMNGRTSNLSANPNPRQQYIERQHQGRPGTKQRKRSRAVAFAEDDDVSEYNPSDE